MEDFWDWADGMRDHDICFKGRPLWCKTANEKRPQTNNGPRSPCERPDPGSNIGEGWNSGSFGIEHHWGVCNTASEGWSDWDQDPSNCSHWNATETNYAQWTWCGASAGTWGTPSSGTEEIYGEVDWDQSQLTTMQPAESDTCLEAACPTEETIAAADDAHTSWAGDWSEPDVAGAGHGAGQKPKRVSFEPGGDVCHNSEETPGGSEGSNSSPTTERRSSEVDVTMNPPGLTLSPQSTPVTTAANAPEPVETFPGCMARDPDSMKADPHGDLFMKPILERNEATPNRTNEDKLEAARRLAVLLSNHGESGFDLVRQVRTDLVAPAQVSKDHIPHGVGDRAAWETMYRLFLIADTDIVSNAARKAASGTGGVEVKLDIKPFPGCPNSGDGGNARYKKLCLHVLALLDAYTNDNANPLPSWLKNGANNYRAITNQANCGDLVEAALGAAEQMLALQEYREGKSKHWKRVWSQMWGAGCANGDIVTKWINDFIMNLAFHDQESPGILTPYELEAQTERNRAAYEREELVKLSAEQVGDLSEEDESEEHRRYLDPQPDGDPKAGADLQSEAYPPADVAETPSPDDTSVPEGTHPATTDQPTTEGRGACPDVKKADQYPAAATPEDGAGNHPPDDTPATEGVPKATTGQPARPDNHISPQSFYGTGLSRKTCTIDWDYWPMDP